MKKAILATKVGMTQIFTDNGNLVPVTVLHCDGCTVTQRKTVESDGYQAIQVGFGSIKLKLANKPKKGHFDKNNIVVMKHLKEFRLNDITAYELGSEIKVDVFQSGDLVDVSGISKGKGYQGTIKRHNAHRGPMGHGSKSHRVTGSMGSSASPSRVPKGKKMAGQMGHEKVTVQNLEIVQVDADKGLLLIKGAVPGPRGSLIMIRDSVKKNID